MHHDNEGIAETSTVPTSRNHMAIEKKNKVTSMGIYWINVNADIENVS